MTEERHSVPDTAPSGEDRAPQASAAAIASFTQLLAPLRALDMLHLRPAMVPDHPRDPPPP
jgi:hypothetical protein